MRILICLTPEIFISNVGINSVQHTTPSVRYESCSMYGKTGKTSNGEKCFPVVRESFSDLTDHLLGSEIKRSNRSGPPNKNKPFLPVTLIKCKMCVTVCVRSGVNLIDCKRDLESIRSNYLLLLNQ